VQLFTALTFHTFFLLPSLPFMIVVITTSCNCVCSALLFSLPFALMKAYTVSWLKRWGRFKIDNN